MKKVILILILLISICSVYAISNGVFAENGQCNNIFNGNCITPANNNLNVSKNYVVKNNYNNTYKNICNNEYGFLYIADTYLYSGWTGASRLKIFITHVKPASPAQRMGLKVGDEITKINNEKVIKTTWDDFANLLKRSNTINLEIKNDSGKRNITLNKDNVCTQKLIPNEIYSMYWSQICDFDVDNASEEVYYAEGITSKLSQREKEMLASAHNTISYWRNKRNIFDNGFKKCTSFSTSDNELHSCLSLLVNNELAKINKEKEFELYQQQLRQQQAALQAQQQLQQQQINAMNNYADALRNQHVQVNQNVYHSGTVDINSNIQFNGTMYHRW